jgi:uncharacterized protein (TIGR03435 family)
MTPFCRVYRLFGLSVLLLQLASAQQPPQAPDLAFETASIRPSQVEPGCFSMLPPGGKQYAITCLTLRDLIAMAWQLHPDNIQGGDAHALATYYDVRATIPDGQRWTSDTIPPMLRRLLADRFHVEVHRGTKQVSGYALIVAKGGSKLKPVGLDSTQQGQKAGQPSPNYIVPGSVHGHGADLSLVASLLSSPAHATVVDRTGIRGIFDFDLHFAFEGGSDPNLRDFFGAVEEQLGLKLRPEKISVDTLVIDHADSRPTEN